jgi:hypothetical protein
METQPPPQLPPQPASATDGVEETTTEISHTAETNEDKTVVAKDDNVPVSSDSTEVPVTSSETPSGTIAVDGENVTKEENSSQHQPSENVEGNDNRDGKEIDKTPPVVSPQEETAKEHPSPANDDNEQTNEVLTQANVEASTATDTNDNNNNINIVNESKNSEENVVETTTKTSKESDTEVTEEVKDDKGTQDEAPEEVKSTEENNNSEVPQEVKEDGETQNEAPKEVISTEENKASKTEINNQSTTANDDGTNSDTTTPIGQSKGAQIILNRFATWRVSANESAVSLLSKTQAQNALQENAKQAQEYAQRMRMRFQQSIKTPSSVGDDEKKGTQEGSQKNEEGKVEKGPTTAEGAVELKQASLSASTSEEDGDVSSGSSSSSSEGDETETDITSEGGGNTVPPITRERMKAVLSRASAAGTVVAESVATSFRGRYTVDASDDTTGDDKGVPNAERKPSPESQVALILKSRAGEHMQEILNQLEDHEFAMLLGRGMLGVNLKQCYLKNHGIFIDYLVPGGQAEQSCLIRSGDLLVRLADIDFRKGTIKEIPGKIASAKRPAVLVMVSQNAFLVVVFHCCFARRLTLIS